MRAGIGLILLIAIAAGWHVAAVPAPTAQNESDPAPINTLAPDVPAILDRASNLKSEAELVEGASKYRSVDARFIRQFRGLTLFCAGQVISHCCGELITVQWRRASAFAVRVHYRLPPKDVSPIDQTARHHFAIFGTNLSAQHTCLSLKCRLRQRYPAALDAKVARRSSALRLPARASSTGL